MKPIISDPVGLAKFLYVQRVTGLTPPNPMPHMDSAGVEFFIDRLKNCRRYVEFGSGGSTVVASRLGIPTISIENDRYYAKAVASQLTGNNVRQILPSLGLSRQWGMPVFPRKSKARKYVDAPWGLDHFPDFILIDGRYRRACALKSAHEARLAQTKAVMMFDDYADRNFYHSVEQFLGKPRMIGRAAIFDIGSQDVPEEAIEIELYDPA